MLLHWVGDFYFQTSEIAEGKSKSWYWLSKHIIYYNSVMIVGLLLLLMTDIITLEQLVCYATINSSLHFCTDYFTSRLAAKYKDTNIRKYYLTIGFDQFIHSATLLLTSPILFLT